MLSKTSRQGIIMKEVTLLCLVFCLFGCVQSVKNQSAVNPPSEDKTTKEATNSQECAKPTLIAENTDATDSIVDEKPNKIVTAAMLGVWGGSFITSISLPFAAVVLPIADLEAGEDAYSKKLKDKFTKQDIVSKHCELN